MPHDAACAVIDQHARQAVPRRIGTVGHDYQAGMLAIAHADAAAMVKRHPACASGGIEQCVEQRPVGNGVRTVAHGLGFTIWARHGARVQMIAADHDGALELARSEEHTSELQSLMRISYAVFCLKNK